MIALSFADLYCGAGGATTGVVKAAKRLGRDIKFGVAINHWPVAVETHSSNHPNVKHLCESIEAVDPCAAVPKGHLDLLWASPECTHHSRARGGKPRQNQSRSGANHILAWLDKLYVKNVIIENVPEFMDWGPLNKKGKSIRAQRGESFRCFIESLKARNYNVDYRVLNAADYGDPTSRRRLFVIARRKPLKVVWPEPSHRAPGGGKDLFSKAKPWRTARSIIDWTDLGTALSARKKPLSPNTMRRIAAGLKKFCGMSFIIPANFGDRKGQQARCNSVDAPLGTVLTSNYHAVVTPFILGQQSCAAPRSTDEPLPTVATDGAIALATPFLVQTDNLKSNGKCIRSVDEPMPTQVTKNNTGVVTPFIVNFRGTKKKQLDKSASSVDEPIGTVSTKDHHAVIRPFLVQMDHTGSKGKLSSVDEPAPTTVTKQNCGLVRPFLVSTRHGEGDLRTADTEKPLPTTTAKGEWGVINPFIVKHRGTSKSHLKSSAESIDRPVSTISTSGKHHLLVQPFIAKYYGTATAQGVEEPLGSVTCKDRFLLVNPATNEQHELEIYFRLLKPGELAAAHSFPKKYKFSGNKTQIVKQIGNSNPTELTAALTGAVM